MNHFEAPHQNARTPPEPGDTVWLVPIRYWEPSDYSPERLDVESVTTDSLYGLHHSYGHSVYVSLHDAKWFFKEEHARQAQLLLSSLREVMDEDDMVPVMKKIMKTVRAERVVGCNDDSPLR